MQRSSNTEEALGRAKAYLIEALRLAEREGWKQRYIRKLEKLCADTEELQNS